MVTYQMRDALEYPVFRSHHTAWIYKQKVLVLSVLQSAQHKLASATAARLPHEKIAVETQQGFSVASRYHAVIINLAFQITRSVLSPSATADASVFTTRLSCVLRVAAFERPEVVETRWRWRRKV